MAAKEVGLTAVTCAPIVANRESLYALSWSYAQDGKIAVDADNGLVLDVNPAIEALMGYSRAELIGKHISALHPAEERERAEAEFAGARHSATLHSGFHILCKDGSTKPVAIWSSAPLVLGGQAAVIAEIRDITEQQQKEHQLSAQNWALSAFSIAALALGRARTEEGLLQSICEAITAESVYALAWVGIAEDGPHKKIRIAASAGRALRYLDGIQLSWAEDVASAKGPAGICIKTDKVQIVDDTETSEGFALWRERTREVGIRSCVSIPLRIQDGWRGTLTVYSVRPRAFGSAPIEVFRHLADQIVHGIEALEHKQLLEAERRDREHAQKSLTEALAASVSAMVTAMEMRDPYTAGHENRTADIAYAIGKEMGWPEGRLQGLRMAAMVHDIGKISIPSELLNKPSRLTYEEFELVKGHPESSYAILKDIPFTWPIAEIVRQHHEKLDGSGYPQGLKGDEILAEAKVLTVADIVEAMAAARPYRKGLGLEVALAEVESQAGTLLDAEVVGICTRLFREGHLNISGLQLD
ncbi:MAG: HD domain-containing phosphohydrolase [Terracidiphilus sp.]|jgi:PAS domain S-box-containing protein